MNIEKTKNFEQLEEIEINGTKQWILSTGNEQGSILFFVHGGPGSTLMMFSTSYDQELRKKFLVIHWDQRGAGKSYSSTIFEKPLSINDYVSDGLEVINFIKQKFSKNKIILIGHSWGTIVASHMANKNPESFSSYVSIGTVVDYEKADLLKYQFITKRNPKEILPRPPYNNFSEVMTISQQLMKENGIFHNLDLESVGIAVESSAHYMEQEFENQSIGAEKSFEVLIPCLKNYRAIEVIPELLVSTYFIQGAFDLATPTSLAKNYYNQVLGPKGKTFIEFKKSAHFPMYEEPELFLNFLSNLT